MYHRNTFHLSKTESVNRRAAVEGHPEKHQ